MDKSKELIKTIARFFNCAITKDSEDFISLKVNDIHSIVILPQSIHIYNNGVESKLYGGKFLRSEVSFDILWTLPYVIVKCKEKLDINGISEVFGVNIYDDDDECKVIFDKDNFLVIDKKKEHRFIGKRFVFNEVVQENINFSDEKLLLRHLCFYLFTHKYLLTNKK